MANSKFRMEVKVGGVVYAVLANVRYLDVRYLPADPRFHHEGTSKDLQNWCGLI